MLSILFAIIIYNKLQEVSKHIISKNQSALSPDRGWSAYSSANGEENSRGEETHMSFIDL
jgi:hypothetical protein